MLPVLVVLLAGCHRNGASVPDVDPRPTERAADSIIAVAGSGWELRPSTRIADPAIDECSGIVFHQGAFWVHNDSGDVPRLFRSATVDFTDVEALPVPGARAVDWEDIATYQGDLLVCDIGDNRRQRDDLTLYRVRYRPGNGRSSLELVATYPIRYPDGRHDAEAATEIDGKLIIVSKAREDRVTNVYEFESLVDADDLAPGEINVPRLAGTLDIGAGEQVTAMTYDPDSRTVIVLTYSAILRYPKERLSGRSSVATRILARQCEAVCLCGPDLVFTNEQRDVFVIHDFTRRSPSEALPARAIAALPVADVPVTIDGNDEEWRAHGVEITLRNTLEGEELRWLSTGDDIVLHGRFRVVGEPVATPTADGQPGTAVVLMFGTERRHRIGGQELIVAVGVPGAEGGAGAVREDGAPDEIAAGVAVAAWRLSPTPDDVVLTPAASTPDVEVSGRMDGGWLDFELEVSMSPVTGGVVPDRFLFDVQATDLHGGDEPGFSGPDYFALYRPYIWGEVTRGANDPGDRR